MLIRIRKLWSLWHKKRLMYGKFKAATRCQVNPMRLGKMGARMDKESAWYGEMPVEFEFISTRYRTRGAYLRKICKSEFFSGLIVSYM